VHEHTLAELKRLDAGYHFSSDGGRTYPFRGQEVTVPTLEEVLNACPGLKFVIEIKQTEPPIEEGVIAVVRQCRREEEVLLASEHNGVMAQVRRLAPELATSFSAAEVRAFIERVYSGRMQDYLPPASALQIPPEHGGIPLVTEETVAAAHALGVEAHVWTINDSQEMERLLNLGVDGIMSDWPSRLRETVERWLHSRYNYG
jgi:glycerophosphoryl diester phosphodiesterase